MNAANADGMDVHDDIIGAGGDDGMSEEQKVVMHFDDNVDAMDRDGIYGYDVDTLTVIELATSVVEKLEMDVVNGMNVHESTTAGADDATTSNDKVIIRGNGLMNAANADGMDVHDDSTGAGGDGATTSNDEVTINVSINGNGLKNAANADGMDVDDDSTHSGKKKGRSSIGRDSTNSNRSASA
eukprot:Tbor_TRINITY_DN5105_c0_g1::TRINITY_DN5105_c0_g1_i8::g.25761::m.25761